MKKYRTEFKLKVVRSFLAGEGGARLLAWRWPIPEENIRTSVSHTVCMVSTGLQPKRSWYSEQFNLQVLSHQDHEQLSSRRIAAIYDIRNPNRVVVAENQVVIDRTMPRQTPPSTRQRVVIDHSLVRANCLRDRSRSAPEWHSNRLR
jgi:hypothetical protein